MGIFDFLRDKQDFGRDKQEFGYFGYLRVELCESYKDVGDDVLFRLVDDPDNVIRIKQRYPLTIPQDWEMAGEEWSLQVAGVSYRVENVMHFIGGSSRRIQLVQEPMVKYPHAIAVYGEWIDKRETKQKSQLGYLPNTDAKKITKALTKMRDYLLVGKLAKMFIPTGEKGTPGLRVDVAIFQTALPKFEVQGLDKKTGRKRKRTYRAKDQEEAILQAQGDGIIVEVDKIKRV
jgi:hypothetical protein